MNQKQLTEIHAILVDHALYLRARLDEQREQIPGFLANPALSAMYERTVDTLVDVTLAALSLSAPAPDRRA